MKRYLMGILAVALAIGFSAFETKENAPKKMLTNYVWFDVAPNAPSQVALSDGDVIFNSSLSAAPASNPSGCSMSDTYNCTVGFNQSQVDASGTHLKPGAQSIQAAYYFRSAQ